MRDLIAISGKQYAGKDQFADFLMASLPGFHKVSLARAIKIEFAELYGLTPACVEADKATYRPALIAIGQRRRQRDADYWIDKVMQHPGPKVIPDMRLRHEYEVFKDLGAFCIRVEADRTLRAQRGRLVQESDPTECELDDMTGWDAVITNDGSLEDLRQAAEQLAKRLVTKS